MESADCTIDAVEEPVILFPRALIDLVDVGRRAQTGYRGGRQDEDSRNRQDLITHVQTMRTVLER